MFQLTEQAVADLQAERFEVEKHLRTLVVSTDEFREALLDLGTLRSGIAYLQKLLYAK